MGKYTTLVRAGIKRHKGSLLGIFFLLFLVSLALGTVMTIWSNSGAYLRQEMQRAGFGNLTAWVSAVEDDEELVQQLVSLEEVEQVDRQRIIFSNYSVGEEESDSEGQLIPYEMEEGRYRFFTEDLSGYQQMNDIASGEIYVSPSMVSMFDLQIGDEIRFPIARSGKDMTFVVKGYYEDPFMGSSMIGMKGFLISKSDYQSALEMINTAGIDALARSGFMLHITTRERADIATVNSIINENTALQNYAEFVHSEHAIYGFMLVLQNAFSGLMLAFVLVLLIAVMMILAHSLVSGIEADYVNMGVLKTVGYTSILLRRVQLMQYAMAMLAGLVAGLCLVEPVSRVVSNMMITTTGMQVPTNLPWFGCIVAYVIVLIILMALIFYKSGIIGAISPMKTIRNDKQIKLQTCKKVSIQRKGLQLRLALRQLMTGRRNYIGACMVAALLVFFLSLVGRMDGWLGSDGKGMMDAFNPADHDIGVQSFGSLTVSEMEERIETYTAITDSYLLAMPGVAVNGVDYTANVISEPQRFHIMQGQSCMADDEVVLTEFVAADLGVEIGDSVMIRGDAGTAEYVVSGIYQCANDMGDNIGMSTEGYLKIGQDSPSIYCHHYFLADASMKQMITDDLEAAYGGDIHVHENSWPGLYGIIAAMQGLVIVMYLLVTIFALVVTAMTGNRILTTEQKDLGIYKAIGCTSGWLRMTFALRFGVTAAIGGVIGSLFAAIVTDPFVSTVMKLAGISNFASTRNVLELLSPIVFMTFLYILFAYCLAGKIKKVDMTVLVSIC